MHQPSLYIHTNFWTVLIEIEKYIVWFGSNKIKSRGDVLYPCKFCHLHVIQKINLYKQFAIRKKENTWIVCCLSNLAGEMRRLPCMCM